MSEHEQMHTPAEVRAEVTHPEFVVKNDGTTMCTGWTCTQHAVRQLSIMFPSHWSTAQALEKVLQMVRGT
jgi:hypothetical protein